MSTDQSRGSSSPALAPRAGQARSPSLAAGRRDRGGRLRLSGPRRPARPCLAACSVMTLLGLLQAPGAHAGTYTIGDCPAAADHADTAGPWWLIEGDAPLAPKQECSGGSGDWMGLAVGENGPLLEGVGFDTAGLPLSIVHIRVWWRAIGAPSGSATAEIVASHLEGALNVPIATWVQPDTGSIWDTTAGPQELEFPASDNVDLVRLGQNCTTPYNTTVTGCKTQSQLQYDGLPVLVQLYGAEVTLLDQTPPTVIVTAAPEASSPITGSMSISFDATDPVGILKSELLVDGAPVATHDYSSSCTYSQLRPCPASESDQLSLEGSSLPEGTHQLAVRVTDAAGNIALGPARSVVTARPPVPNGDPCPRAAITVAADRERRVMRIPFGERPAIQGRLACGTTPISGASIDLESAPALGAFAPTVATLQTAANGTFRYKLPVGADRMLTFRYRAYSNEPSPTAQTALKIEVVPKITLHIRPRRTDNGGTITWRGAVKGGPYPVRGLPLLLQVRDRHRWQTFDQIVARNGKIGYRYTFRRTFQPTTYSFRVALPAGGAVGYPYASGASRTIRVHVG
jgi:hypothetical protein